LPLHDDIFSRISTFCPDFETLQALILVCKALHAIFSKYPNSITTAVAYNLMGPAFGEALNHIRYTVDDDNDGEAASDSPGLGDPSESPTTAAESAETTLLRKNAAVVHSLEVLFSQWYKNGGASASVLTAEEAFRFRRAMYRVMTYSARFSASAYTEEEAHEISADPDALKEIRDQRVSMLNKYSTAGLREIHTIACFLTQVIDWAVQD
ncbi:hypothetical protein B0H13DRAFT_2578767, partial [Mycena leptocephala]